MDMASPGSDGALQAGLQLSSSSSRDSTMASKLQNAKSLTIQVLQDITDDFSEKRKIGQGAYGKVYVVGSLSPQEFPLEKEPCHTFCYGTILGMLENGEEIAVKMLYNNMPGIDDEQFRHEFENLMRLEHHNIVRLVGYCYDTQYQPIQYMGRAIFVEKTYRALCFEYMQNGSLQKHLSDECDGLDWHTRYKIIKGTCEGLKYLHEGFEEPIYHLDLKPDNILLDKNMVPKLADFGLSKLFGDGQTRITQSPIGTIGYLPMEYLQGNLVSNKFDIFSLGVVMTKIITGPRGHSRSDEMSYQEFLDLVHKNWRNRLQATYAFRPLEAYCEQVNICTEIALRCMEIDRHKRPNIMDIIHQLYDTEAVIDKALSSMPAVCQKDDDTSLVKVEAFTRCKAIFAAQTYNEFPVLVRVTAAPWRHAEEMRRASVDVVAVLDMNWIGWGMNWISWANGLEHTKQAMMIVIDKLGPNDRLSMVAFETSVDRLTGLTYMSDQDRDVARLKIVQLKASNGWDMGNMAGAALREGAQILRGRTARESRSRVGCIMLVTAPYNNEYHEILNQEISPEFPVHTFSMDVHSDEVPRIMKYIADKTSGTYSFVIHPVNTDSIKDAFALFIAGLTSVVAMPIKITLRAHEGVTISSIESDGYGNFVSSDKRYGEIDIDTMCARERKNFIVYMTVAESKSLVTTESEEKLVTVSGRYRSFNASKQLADMDMFVLRPHSGCSSGKLAIHPEVAAELTRIRLKKGISAISAIQEQYLTDKGLQELWDGVRDSEEGRGAPKETLSELDKDVTKMMSVEEDSDKQYMLSWLTCHKWQRATTKGGCDNSCAFQTIAQDADGEDYAERGEDFF